MPGIIVKNVIDPSLNEQIESRSVLMLGASLAGLKRLEVILTPTPGRQQDRRLARCELHARQWHGQSIRVSVDQQSPLGALDAALTRLRRSLLRQERLHKGARSARLTSQTAAHERYR